MAVKILKDGEDISTMPIEYAPNFTKEYNKDICEELGITVPDDYVAIGEAAEDTEEASDDADAADEATAETAEDDVTEEAAE
jgi:putative ABC transport system substrate-binding protein